MSAASADRRTRVLRFVATLNVGGPALRLAAIPSGARVAARTRARVPVVREEA
jgi:hypothetical protein